MADRGKAAQLSVRIDGGETVTLAVRLMFSDDGALLRVLVPVGAGRLDPRDQAARRLVQQIDAELARPHAARGGAPGVVLLAREAELRLGLAEQLEELEARLGPVVARAQRMASA